MNKNPQKSILGKVKKTILNNQLIQKDDRIVVAVSGGADSISLLSILMQLRDDLHFSLSACHFNHRLRGEASDADEKFVQKICDQWGIDLITGGAPKKNQYKNEDMARDARYAFFEKILEEGRGDKIAIAHHQNDSAETFLMRLLRGSGLKGLGSIPLSRGQFIRPLLCLSRAEIESYLAEKKIRYQTDETNSDEKLLRNKLRCSTLPYLSQINPNIIETLASTAEVFQDDYDLLNLIGENNLAKITLRTDKNAIHLNYRAWLALHPSMQRLTLRLALEKVGCLKDISLSQIGEMDNLLKKGAGKKKKLLPHSLRMELENAKIKISKI